MGISFTKDVVYLCRGADTEVHSPQRPVTEWRALPCLTALYRFSARLSSAVSGEPFDRSSSNLDTSIIRPLPFRRIKKKKNGKNGKNRKNRKNSRKSNNFLSPPPPEGRKKII